MAIDRNAIHRRAARQAASKYAAKKDRIAAQEAAAKRGYHTDIGATRGAAAMSRDALSADLASLGSTGLHGLALQQVKDELARRSQATHGMVAFEKATAKPDLQSTLQTLDDQAFSLSQQEADKADSLYAASVNRHQTQQKHAVEKFRAITGRVSDATDRAIQKTKNFNQQVTEAMLSLHDFAASNFNGPGAASMEAARADLASNAAGRKATVERLQADATISRRAAEAAVALFIKRHSNPKHVVSDTPDYIGRITAPLLDEIAKGSSSSGNTPGSGY